MSELELLHHFKVAAQSRCMVAPAPHRHTMGWAAFFLFSLFLLISLTAIEMVIPVMAHAKLMIEMKDEGGGGGGGTSYPPSPPTLNPVTTPTNHSPQLLSGSKPANTSILNNGAEIVPLNASTTWSYNLPLQEGNNSVSLVSKNSQGQLSAPPVAATIVCDTTPPSFTIVDPTDGTVTHGQ